MNIIHLLFSCFFAASLRGTLLALVVLALQAMLYRWMPARWRYALWMPVILVLAAPVLPSSRWSIENRFLTAAPKPVLIETVEKVNDASPALASAPLASAKRAAVDWKMIVGFAWITGSAGVFAFLIGSYRRTLRRLRSESSAPSAALQMLLEEAATKSKLRSRPRLLVSFNVQGPAVTGFFRPLLLLPANFVESFSTREARLILLHELTHLKRWDLQLNWLLCLLRAIHWWNPVLWFVFARIRADRESACDAEVLRLAGEECRADYGHALLGLEGALASASLNLGFVGIFERAAEIRVRIRDIARYRHANPLWNIAGAALVLILAIAGGTRAQEPSASSNSGSGEATKRAPKIQHKLDTIIIPKLDLREATFAETVDFLKRKSVALDPEKEGVKITAPPDVKDFHLTASLRDISLGEVLKYVADLGNMKLLVEEGGVKFVPGHVEPKPDAGLEVEKIKKKLATIVLPRMEFREAHLRAALDYLHQASVQLDPEKKGVNIVLRLEDAALAAPKAVQGGNGKAAPDGHGAPEGPQVNPEITPITVSLTNIPLGEALHYVTNLAGLKCMVDADGVTVVSLSAPTEKH